MIVVVGGAAINLFWHRIDAGHYVSGDLVIRHRHGAWCLLRGPFQLAARGTLFEAKRHAETLAERAEPRKLAELIP